VVSRFDPEGVHRFEEHLVDKTPSPVFTGFEATHHGVLRLMKMSCRVAAGGIVAAADVTALQAKTQVNPMTARREAFLAPGRSLGFDRLDLGEMRAARASTHWLGEPRNGVGDVNGGPGLLTMLRRSSNLENDQAQLRWPP
jgi:hypothetical protein